MAIALSITYTNSTQSQLVIDGTLTFSGSYTTGGDTLSFAADLIKTDYPPVFVQIQEMPAAGTAASGFTYVFGVGTTLANGSVQVFEGGASASSPMAQLAAGAYPAGITGASVRVRAWFLQG